MDNIFDIAIEICVAFLVVFTPLAFGSVGLGPQIILISVSELIFLLWFIKSIKSGKTDYPSGVFIFLFTVFLALIFFQTIPLPKFLLKALSPATYKNYMDFLPGYKEHFMWRSISIYPEATKLEFFKFLSYGFIVFVIANSLNKKQQLLRILTVISVTGFIVACFGIVQKFTSNGMIYWVQPVPEGASQFGPFVNKNHFAGFMELTIPITAAFVFISERLEKKSFFGFMAIVMLLALFLCLSRAGIVSFLAASGLIFLAAFLRRSLKRYLFYVLPAALLIAVFAFLIAKAPLVERFSAAPAAIQGRWQIYKDIFRMFKDFPLFGVGLGDFGKIFSMYKTFASDVVYANAHNDWLQFLTETGLIGLFYIVALMVLFFKDIFYCHFLGRGDCVLLKATRLRHDRVVIIIIAAGLVSLISIIFHGIFDINLHIPSNVLLVCIIGAVLINLAHSPHEVV